MKAWLDAQSEAFRGLLGLEVLEWRGREMALDQDETERPLWRLPNVEVLQLDRLEAIGAETSICVTTIQNDDHFGLKLQAPWLADWQSGFDLSVPVDASPFLDDPKSIFRDVRLPQLPIGKIEDVSVRLSEEGGDIGTVTLLIGNAVVSMKAAEVYPGFDGSITIVDLDESILVQVDGAHPDDQIAGPHV
ncbi:MAG: hypothetical protein HYU62_14010 [Caulobacterales bacterium]|nr:hypothetical protein [Caulobacterales bacterium]